MKILKIVFIAFMVCSACSSNYNVSAEKFWTLKDRGAVVIDVRTPEEYSTGHITGSSNMPYDKLDLYKTLLPVNYDSQILVYCRSGRRSDIARDTLTKMGYTNVLNAGGYEDLISAKAK